MASDQVVLVTGISGFLGSHVADQFLEAGYRVRGTAREVSKVDAIKKTFDSKYGVGKVEVVAVPDITVESAFDEAVKGIFLNDPHPLENSLTAHRGLCRCTCSLNPELRQGPGQSDSGYSKCHYEYLKLLSHRAKYQAFRLH
jgi:hypothetical protein